MPVRALIRDTRGASLIEAALILPLLLLVVFAIADLALYLWQLNSAAKAVQLGARRATVSLPAANGPGLTVAESFGYWNGMQPGAPCAPLADGTSACPSFSVVCSIAERCVCAETGCGFALDTNALATIVAAMQAALPNLRAGQVEITYATNHLGHVGRPIPVPVDISVRIVDLRYDLLFLAGLGVSSFPISAVATMPSELMGFAGSDE